MKATGSLIVAVLIALSSHPVARAGVVNGSFEDPSLGPWVVYPTLPGSTTIGAVSSAEVLPVPDPVLHWEATSENLFLYMTARSNVPMPYMTVYTGAYQTISVAEEDRLSFDVFLDSATPASSCSEIAKVMLIPPGTSQPMVQMSWTNLDPGPFGYTGWQHVEWVMIPPGEYDLYFVLTSTTYFTPNGCDTAAMGVDNVQVVPVIPEPATAGLLALAALPTLRRRR